MLRVIVRPCADGELGRPIFAFDAKRSRGHGAIVLGKPGRNKAGLRRTRSAAGSAAMRQLSPPGSTLARICLALSFSTLPNSGSLAIIVMKFLASFSVMCGGKGGTFGSV